MAKSKQPPSIEMLFIGNSFTHAITCLGCWPKWLQCEASTLDTT